MPKGKLKRVPTIWEEAAVLWKCPSCGAYNLHVLRWQDFDCISCGTILYAQADSKVVKRPR